MNPVDRLQLEATLEYFYGKGAAKHLPWTRVSCQRSRRSQRLKKVLLDGRLFATVREDGSVAFSLECAGYLLRSAAFRESCIVVNEDAAQFVVRGKSLFSKHVVKAGKNVKPGLEVGLLDREGKLLAVGKAILPREYMGRIQSGAAVRVREGILSAGGGKDLSSETGDPALK
jgi:predicted RNA-binding protein (TIGR00451 family)